MDEHGHVSSRWLLYIAGLMLATAGLILAVAFYDRIATEPPWSPLGDAPTQDVTDPGNRILTSGLVHTTATKCYDEAVLVHGSIAWVSVEPPGTIIETPGGVASHPRGCSTRSYANPIPVSVRKIVESGGPSRWKITGTETPTDGKREGVTRVWSTEPFTLVPAP